MIEIIKRYNQDLLNAERGNLVDIISKKASSRFNFALGFSSEYKYAIQTPGFQLIYYMINDQKDVFCERFYYPNKDKADIHRSENIPILTQETSTPINEKQILFFSLNYEGNYPKLLDLLEMSHIQVYEKNRQDLPLMIAGGICPTYNPAVLSNFFDAIVIGEAEDTLEKIITCFKQGYEISQRKTKERFLKKASEIEGVYVPLIHEGEVIKRARTSTIDHKYRSFIVTPNSYDPNAFYIEITRGCDKGCNFCALSKVFGKMRHISKETVIKTAKNMREYTDLIRLVTPSDIYHPDVLEIYSQLKEMGYKFKIGSQRADLIKRAEKIFQIAIPDKITAAPETASQKIKRVIGKSITRTDIYNTADIAIKYEIPKLGLFFIVGFPSEKKEDSLEIIDLVKDVRKYLNEKNAKEILVELTINSHIKKPHTIFERHPQQDLNEYAEIVKSITQGLLHLDNIKVNSMDLDLLALECILVRGSKKEGDLLYKVYKSKANPRIIRKDLEKVVVEDYFREFKEELPWRFVSIGGG